MPREDASIDRLLKAAHRPAETGASADCLDPETLAAWFENRLAAAPLARAEAHAASCARCQGMLAAMARTADAGADSAPGARARSGFSRALPWAVPFTAAATAAVLYFAVRPQPAVSPVEQRPASTVARSQAPAASPAETSAERSKDTERKQEEKEREKDLDAVRGPAPARPAAGAETPSSRDEKKAVTLEERAAQQQRAMADAVLPKVAEPGALAGSRVGSTVPAPSAPPAPAAAATPPPAALAPVVPDPKRNDTRARAAGAARQEALQETIAFAQAPPLIASPDPSVRWRITNGRQVDHSRDGGETWTTVVTETAPILTAGFAPSRDVCWIVGRAGTILRTTDGRTWQRIPFPVAADLFRVVAAGADVATVSTTDGRTFSTKDGGKTWTP